MKYNLEILSKTVSYILRHAPWEYELELDGEGWVNIDDLVKALQLENHKWSEISISNLKEMVDKSSKKRHEISGNKIRALYGHSTPYKLLKERATPPSILYHGTSFANLKLIQAEGLKPMSRHYVHLSTELEIARQVGGRKSKQPIILVIHAEEASKNGANFYVGNDKVWLADYVKPRFIVDLIE